MRAVKIVVPGAVALTVLLAACGGSTDIAGGSNTPAASPSTSASAGAAAPATSGDSSTSASSGDATNSSAPASSAAGKYTKAAFTCPTDADTFTFASGGDVNIQDLWQKTLLPAWKTACPSVTINFTFDTHSANANLDVAKVGAALKAGKEPSVDLTDNFSQAAVQAGIAEPVTATDVPSLVNVSADQLAAQQNSAVPFRGSAVLLAYDSTKITAPPTTLDALVAWIKANPGKFTYNSPATGGSGSSFVQTVVAAGIPADALTKMQTSYDAALDANFAPGLAALKELTPSVYQQTYPQGNQAVLDLLGKGEIEMAPVWSDQFLSAQKGGTLGAQYKVVQISEPSFTGGSTFLTIIKGSKHKAAAAAFVNWLLQPEQQATIVTTIAGFPAIPIDALPSDAQGAFAGIDTQDLRPEFESKTNADLQKQWAATVSG